MISIDEKTFEQVERALEDAGTKKCRLALIALRIHSAKISDVSTPKIGLRSGTAVVWPSGLESMLGISAPTRWRWEKDGKLPPRDISIGDRTGWSHAILNAAGISTK